MSAHALPSPPLSGSSPSASISFSPFRPAGLPTPRTRPLKPGSQKEVALINYLDGCILRINRRYAKKFSNEKADGDPTVGYTNFEEVVIDIDRLLDVVWVSATPSVQIPYLLSLAGLVCSYMSAFDFSLSVFHITNRLDLAFAGLISNPHTGNQFGAETRSVSVTEKVRIKSLIEETRVIAVQTAIRKSHISTFQDLTSDDDEFMDDNSDDEGSRSDLFNNSGDSESTSIALSKIYKRTLEILGDKLN